MTSKQRSYLKGLAMTMDPILQIGKSSLTPELTQAVDEALEARELIKIHVLKTVDRAPKIFEKEFEVEYQANRNLPYTVEVNEDGEYVVEGPRIEKMLGYTNLDSEKGFSFFQKFLKENGILDELEKAGIQEGDTVRMYGLVFDYYK